MIDRLRLRSAGPAQWLRRATGLYLVGSLGLHLLSVLAKLTPSFTEPGTSAWTLLLLLTLGINLLWAIWLYLFHKDLGALFTDYPISPWKSVAMLLIPLYNYWGNWRMWKVADAHLPGPQPTGAGRIPTIGQALPWFYLGWFTTRALGRVSLRLPDSIPLELALLLTDSLCFGGLYLLCLSADRGLQQAAAAQETAPALPLS